MKDVAILTMQTPDPELEPFYKALGMVINGYQNLELFIRVFLNNNRVDHTVPKPDVAALENAEVRSQVPLNAFTDYRSLGELVNAANQHAKAISHGFCIDKALVDFRDALAHGRKYALRQGLPFRLIKFGRPKKGDVVEVEFSQLLTTEWLLAHSKVLDDLANRIDDLTQV